MGVGVSCHLQCLTDCYTVRGKNGVIQTLKTVRTTSKRDSVSNGVQAEDSGRNNVQKVVPLGK
eukprot:2364256-Amphidinium_carterae.1